MEITVIDLLAVILMGAFLKKTCEATFIELTSSCLMYVGVKCLLTLVFR